MRLLAVIALLALPLESFAQVPGGAGPVPSNREPTEDLQTRGSLSQAELKRLTEQIEQWNRVEGKAGVPPLVAKTRTTAMLKVLNVSCVVSDAAYRGTAPDDTEHHIYEAACEDGMGYLLLLKHSSLRGTSCLAAGQEKPQLNCVLPASADSKVMAGAILNRHQIQCKVRDLKWLGSSAANLDHIEITCESSGGYVLRTPRPGSSGILEVFSCQEASKQGVACESIADSRPPLSWFKEALTKNGVSCLTKRARIVGRESIKRRYLVEFECSDRPEGLVAFVPPAGDTVNAFESMNCASAAMRGIRCELSVKP